MNSKTYLFIVSISISSHHDPAHVGDLYFWDFVLSLSPSSPYVLLRLILLCFMFRNFSRSLLLVFSSRTKTCRLCVTCFLTEVRCCLVAKLHIRVGSLREIERGGHFDASPVDPLKSMTGLWIACLHVAEHLPLSSHLFKCLRREVNTTRVSILNHHFSGQPIWPRQREIQNGCWCPVKYCSYYM